MTGRARRSHTASRRSEWRLKAQNARAATLLAGCCCLSAVLGAADGGPAPLSAAAANATIGFIFPITSVFISTDPSSPLFGPDKDLYWIKLLLRWPSAALLAVHHVNTRNATIVGIDTMSRIPENFKLSYRLADSRWSTPGAAQAISDWTSCKAQAFERDACNFLEAANYSRVNDAGVAVRTTPGVEETCKSTVSSGTSSGLYEAPADSQITAIVGVPTSNNAKIVSTIADLQSIPVMSFAATESVLQDKTMYPRFSRTNPGTRPMIRALVGVISHFGWEAINIVNVGNARGLSQTSELLDEAATANITVASTHVFSNLDDESIGKALLALSRAMYNSSASARTRVTVLIAANLGNVRSVLEHGAKNKIIQAGFVWINVDGNNMQNVVATNDMSRELIRSFAGWLNLKTYPRSNQVTDKTLNDVEHHVMWHPEIARWGKFWEEHLPAFKVKGWQAELYSSASLQPTASEAFSFDCVYDAVWATAIGLAAAAVNDEMHKIEKWCRNGGGKGAFQGAAGLVSFDEKGERDTFGLVYTLENLQGPELPAEAARRTEDESWEGFDFASHWRVLGTYEESRGFEAAEGVVPYWPGGLRGWEAPHDRFNDEDPPAAAPEPVVKEVYVERETVVEGGLNGTLAVAVAVPVGVCFLLLLLVSYRLWRHTKKMKLDQDEESMRVSTQQLRQILQITLEHGYLLSTESRAVWHRFGKYVIIPKVQMEAAVRLWRREDFDIDAFDAFCVLIADNDYHAHANDSTDGVDSVEKGDRVNGSTGFVRPVPLQGKGPPFGSSAADLEVGATSGRAQGTQVDRDGRAPDQLQLLRQWVLEQASGAFAEVSIGKIMQTAVMGQRTLSRPQLYRYLCHKVMHLRIFRDSSCSLFNELKVHVQVFTNRLAGLCNERVRKIAEEPSGAYLCTFVFTPDKGIFIPEPHEQPSRQPSVEGCSARYNLGPDKSSLAGRIGEKESMQTEPILRQDDERVRAVEVRSDDLLERALDSSNELHLWRKPDEFGFSKADSEEVYIAQLHRRAVILDRRFKDKVMEAFNLSASESYSDNEYGVGKPSPRPSPTVTASTESHWKMSTGTRSGSETDKNPKLNCDPSDHGHPSCDQTSQTSTASLTFVREGKVTHAEIVFANVKKQGRMREKLARYEPPYPGSQWPLTAHITDPVRLSVVCSGPSDVMQTVRLFVETQSQTGLKVCRIKNKFLHSDMEAKDGYRDVTLNVLFEAENGLKIIGEIQVHDKELYEVKDRMHKLYAVKRAQHPINIV